MRRFSSVILTAVMLTGCGGSEMHERATDRGNQTFEIRQNYLAACRAIVNGLRGDLAESAVLHEIWPDIREASVHVAPAGRRGVFVLVTIRATGPETCTVSLFCSNDSWRQRVTPIIHHLGETKKKTH